MKVIDYWQCPCCKLRITPQNHLQARYNYSCPNCGQHTLKEFNPVYKKEDKKS